MLAVQAHLGAEHIALLKTEASKMRSRGLIASAIRHLLPQRHDGQNT
jgi:hypothetical protein